MKHVLNAIIGLCLLAGLGSSIITFNPVGIFAALIGLFALMVILEHWVAIPRREWNGFCRMNDRLERLNLDKAPRPNKKVDMYKGLTEDDPKYWLDHRLWKRAGLI